MTGNDTAGVGGPGCLGSDCAVTIIDVVLTADPTDDISLWANFDYVNTSGDDNGGAAVIPGTGLKGEAFGIAVAGRLAVTEKTGVASRVEYVTIDEDMAGTADDVEVFSLTGTVDHSLTDNLAVRGEVRWDHSFEKDGLGFPPPGSTAGSSNKKDQVVAIAEIYFAF
jgi:hypothetical protein